VPAGSETCLFCKIAAGELPATIVDEDDRTIAFMDINPATRGHALVIPRAHADDLHEIGADDLRACAIAAQRLAGRAGHFMPAALLASQFADLEPPASDEHALSVDIGSSPVALADEIVSMLGLARQPR